MIKNISVQILLLLLLTFHLITTNVIAQTQKPDFKVKTDSLNWFDKARNRQVPVTLYLPFSDKKIVKQKVIIFSHGYYQNMPGGNRQVSYLTEKLASQGYFVASIQHELPTDDLIPQPAFLRL